MTELRWQKSSFSSEASNCLELATAPDGTLQLRESDDPATTIAVPLAGFRSLLTAVRQEIAGRRP
ncbi:hypothetical protein GCM10010372_12790 [Streptomyces tauricus]|uniref:DUF397 domain-containing protein n=1 Tax=Streptomyces tauricus TaxID=68274 RepID=UPI001673ACFD|nr:DUF397 domain-containing protein [Streptomyces tauricus]GHA14568.1 hypothetical protein GCM10010372_12790 [Streptomyces tauricus]